jgi:hypothetical protein
MTIDAWGFIQSFFFSIPHSFGYSYPSRATGFISIGLSLYILFFVFIVLKNALGSYKSLRDSSLINKIDNLSPCLLQGIFFGVFPLFFMSCLTLSPMQMNPLEYWPSVGLFGNFACADIYRYRWVHSLFPFYFAIISVGTAAVFTNSSKKVLYKSIAIIGILFFTLAGIVKSVQLYSKNDFGKIFFYKGYNYDRLANRFILLNFIPGYDESKALVLNYPDENKPEVYRCLGTRAILSAAGEHQLEQYLSEVPEHYLDDFIYGIVRAAQNMPENRFQPFRNFLERMYPDMFYKNWGFRYLAYKYFGLLLNQKKLFEEIPSAEKWFFKKFLKKFKREISKSDTGLLKEIDSIPKSHQHNVVKGLGMLVGAEMLFDPLSLPDYPLDSRFGKKLNSALQESFYEGIGAGFAETLCRFWRRLLPPEDVRPDLYEKMLEIEWQRCHSLMSKMPTAVYPAIKEGFVAELKRRHLNPLIRNFIDEKFKKGRANTKNHYL